MKDAEKFKNAILRDDLIAIKNLQRKDNFYDYYLHVFHDLLSNEDYKSLNLSYKTLKFLVTIGDSDEIHSSLIQNSDWKTVKKLVKSGLIGQGVQWDNESWYSLLGYAILKNDKKFIKHLIEKEGIWCASVFCENEEVENQIREKVINDYLETRDNEILKLCIGTLIPLEYEFSNVTLIDFAIQNYDFDEISDDDDIPNIIWQEYRSKWDNGFRTKEDIMEYFKTNNYWQHTAPYMNKKFVKEVLVDFLNKPHKKFI
jgi:hypothetical protein